jgi:hypothetical protein
MMGHEQAIDRLARDVRDLRIEFERFFAGALPTPPEELRTQVQAQLRELRNANLQTAADHFRLSSVEAQFNAYNELHNRRLREREEGRTALVPAVQRAATFDPVRGVVVEESPAPGAVEALFQRLYGSGGAKVDLETFRAYVAGQLATIRARTGCTAVQFRVAEENGKMRLKAKPVAAPSAARLD